MTIDSCRPIARTLAAGLGLAAATYGVYAALAWVRYGRPAAPPSDQHDELLDLFLPDYDVVERHRITVAAPAAVTLDAAKAQDLYHSAIVRAIFKTREILLNASPRAETTPRGLLAAVRSLGWGVLADVPGREIVMGAVTKPWEANVTFRALLPEEFRSFSDPGFVQIAWTLRADPAGEYSSVFRTETRARGTDATARALFRPYWALASPGIALIRRLSLNPVKRAAERHAAGIGRAAFSAEAELQQTR
jgi:hypothetical protein